MANDCSNVPTNITYDCANPWGQGCTSDKHFDFLDLWKYTLEIHDACPNDPRLFIHAGGIASPQNASLTQAGCAAIAGSSWTYYLAADIWTRLTTWKFPLLQLVASFPRPPLSFSVECFVLLHLLGDPIDTIKNLLAKMSSCQNRATEWSAICEELLPERPSGEDEDRDWKALALITDAYGEWNEDGTAKLALEKGLRDNPERKAGIASAIRQTGRALAADRSTKSLPIVVALGFFISTVGIAIFRTAAAAGAKASSNTVFINVEAHSIAFSALYFWIIPAVFLGSIIGVSQTEAAIPRILRRFQEDVERLKLENEIKLPNACLDAESSNEQRIFHGGIYSWQPHIFRPLHRPWTCHNILPYLIVMMGTAAGMAVSALVPPDGWDCRHIGEVLILIAWLLSARIDIWLNHLFSPLKEDNRNKLFWITGCKDLLVTVATMGGVITTQVGVFNRCACYTLWGKTGLALPNMPDTAQILFSRLNTTYPIIIFICIGIDLIVVPLFICFRYSDALRTFVQRDDRKSNAKRLWHFLRWCRDSKAALQSSLPRFLLGLSKGKRTGTVVVEEALPGDSSEMQSLTQTLSEEPQSIAADDDSVAGAHVADEQFEPAGPVSQSSGVDSLFNSGDNMQSTSEPRPRNTQKTWATI